MTDAALRRLLNLFPAAAIRQEWTPAAKLKDDIVGNIASSVQAENIVAFARTKMGLTKQHVRLFTHGIRRPSDIPDDLLSELGLRRAEPAGRDRDYFYLVQMRFDYVAGSPPVEDHVDFLWPVRLVFRGAILEAYFTTMEKDIASYISQQPTIKVHRSIEPDDIIKSLNVALRRELGPLDINKGVKSLWANDRIDAGRAQWKESNSTHTDTMDSDLLLKKDKAEFYQRAIKAPLLKTVFKTLDDSLGWPDVFGVDASIGELAITRYSHDEHAVENLVREILRRN